MIDKLRNLGISGRIIGAAGAVLLALYTFSPKTSPFGAGMSIGQFILELLPAAFVGVTALCLVLIYRTVRIVNFAQVAFAVVGMQLFYEFYSRGVMPYELAWPVGVLGGTLMTLIVGVIMSTLFFRHPRLTLTVVTVFMTGVVQYASGEITAAFQKPGEQIQIVNVPLEGTFWHGTLVTLGGIPIRYAHVLGLILVSLVLAGLILFFRKTRVGIAVRASAENSDRAALLGINVKLINVGVWALVGLITSVAAIARMPVSQYVPGSTEAFDGLLPALSAAVLARFTSLPAAFGIGMGIHYAQQSLFLDTGDTTLMAIFLFFAVLVGLLLQRQQYTRVDSSSSWKAVREIRPTPVQLLALRSIRRTRQVLWGLFVLIALGLPWVLANETTFSLAEIYLSASILASLVVLTGWAGQISLGQTALVGAGALFAANATMSWGLPFLLAVPLGGLAGALIATLVGIPALRIQGLFLAVVTFGLAALLPVLLFNGRYLAGLVPSSVDSPSFFGATFDEAKFRYYFLLVLFLIVAAIVRSLRNSRAGRLLIALRDNEQGVQSFGVDVVRTRLMAFAISGFIAGICGAISVHVSRGFDTNVYNAQFGFLLFQLAIVGGISSLSGAFLGGAFLTIGRLLFPGLFGIVTGIGGLMLMMFMPGGFAQAIFGMRDAVLRVVALRKHIIVPSLFADYSPEAWEKRLTPLAPTAPSQGLSALRADQRYALESRLYGRAHS